MTIDGPSTPRELVYVLGAYTRRPRYQLIRHERLKQYRSGSHIRSHRGIFLLYDF